MKSCPPRRECPATPNAGGYSARLVTITFAILSLCFALVVCIQVRMAGRMVARIASRIAVRDSRLACSSRWAACMALALVCCLLPVSRAAHAAGGPVLPALQSLINSATVSPASAASATDAASAPSPASQAELNRSLDSVITIARSALTIRTICFTSTHVIACTPPIIV